MKKDKIIKLIIPQSWNDLSINQLESVALLFSNVKPSAKFDLRVLYILLDLKWWQYIQKAKVRIVLWNVPMSDLRSSFDFIYSNIDRTVFPKFIKAKKQTFFAPQDRIANLTVKEFSVADDLHIQWRLTKNIDFLHYLAAVLYTRTKLRPLFDKNALHDQALLFNKVPIKKLLAMEIAYFGCKKNLEKRFPKVFPEPTAGTTKPKKKYGFGKVILSMTKGDLSKLETIEKVNVYTFLEQFEEDLTPVKL
jgi:hypothetical protein